LAANHGVHRGNRFRFGRFCRDTEIIGAADAPEQIDDVVAANRILASHEIFDRYGDVSVRNASNPQRYLMSRAHLRQPW
jgi:hypothetical protein